MGKKLRKNGQEAQKEWERSSEWMGKKLRNKGRENARGKEGKSRNLTIPKHESNKTEKKAIKINARMQERKNKTNTFSFLPSPFQVVLQGKSRNLIIRELQRTNLDVNLAVNNLLSRDDENEEDPEDSQVRRQFSVPR